MTTVYPVTIGEVRYSPDFQTTARYEQAWQRVLASNYPLSELGKTAVCRCSGRGEKRLTIKPYGPGTYGLAKFPKSGPQHDSDCKYHEESSERSGIKVYHSVIQEGDDGTLAVKLQMGLRMQEPRPESWLDRTPRAGIAHQRGTMTLLGLLHLLWQRAGLNQWWPRMQGKRTAVRVGVWVREAASDIKCSRAVVADHLIVGCRMDDYRGAASTRRALQLAATKGKRMLGLLTLTRYSPEIDAGMAKTLRPSPYCGLPWMNMPEGLWEAARKRFHLALSHWRAGGKLVALAQLEVHGPDRTSVVGLALMAVCDNWIPVESSYELQVANALVHEGRSFIKPLRFDADADVVFPDFILRDGLNRDGVPMEVFGRDDAVYRARKASKSRYYADNFGTDGWWQWDASSNQAMPPLPPMRDDG